jgi:glycosyltransferase involved in cell wall biosynthesis
LEALRLPSIEGTRIITLVANLRHPVKNVPMFLRSARQVLDQARHVHFVIAGEGDLESELRGIASDLGIAHNVTFTGRCNDVPALLSASYACVLTSSAEGFSNSILEYMAAGKPVVATDVGGAREAIVDGGTGYLVQAHDDAALAQRLVLLLSDGDLAKRIGDKGKERVRVEFSPEAQLSNTIALYQSLLNNA